MTFLEEYLEDPVRFARVKRLFYACLSVLALTEAVAPRLVYGDHPHFPFEDWPAWGAIYGFFSCVVIITVSKRLGKRWLMRSEDHYDS
ncbi:MAG: hypothetical protein EXQ55_07530 [Acidobacteria bacterium]|nr:hypothetical protein [Acidobacteriota bacterium]